MESQQRGRRKSALDISTYVYGKVPPQDVEMEKAILGACMLEPDEKTLHIITKILKPHHFYKDQHQTIFQIIVDLFSQAIRPDALLVSSRLKDVGKLELVGGPYAIISLTNNVVSTANIEVHARIILQKWIQRRMIRAAGDMLSKSYDDSVDVFEGLEFATNAIAEIEMDIAATREEDFESIVFESVREILENDGSKSGIDTGFSSLNALLNGGWQNKFIVIAGRPAMGKTALLIQLVLLIAENVPVGIIELEATRMEVVTRMMSNKLQKSASFIKRGAFSPEETEEISTAASDLINNQIFIDFNPDMDILQLRAKVRYWVKTYGVRIVFIDYLQIIEPGNEKDSREQQVSKMSRALQKLSKELNIPVIAFAQIGRDVEKRGNPTPKMSDLRESGGIENNARVVIFIHRPEYYEILTDELGESTKGKTYLIVAKNNEGELGRVTLEFSGATNTFTEEEKFIPAPRF